MESTMHPKEESSERRALNPLLRHQNIKIVKGRERIVMFGRHTAPIRGTISLTVFMLITQLHPREELTVSEAGWQLRPPKHP